MNQSNSMMILSNVWRCENKKEFCLVIGDVESYLWSPSLQFSILAMAWLIRSFALWKFLFFTSTIAFFKLTEALLYCSMHFLYVASTFGLLSPWLRLSNTLITWVIFFAHHFERRSAIFSFKNFGPKENSSDRSELFPELLAMTSLYVISEWTIVKDSRDTMRIKMAKRRGKRVLTVFMVA